MFRSFWRPRILAFPTFVLKEAFGSIFNLVLIEKIFCFLTCQEKNIEKEELEREGFYPGIF
jgi:hypothetical protein